MPRGRAGRGVPQRHHRPARPTGARRSPQPEVVSAKIVSPTRRRADHGDPRLPRPDGHAEPSSATRPTRAYAEFLDGIRGELGVRGAALPARLARPPAARSRRPRCATSRARIYGRGPTDIDVDAVVDLCVVGAGPAGLAAAVYGASEGLDGGRPRGGGGRRPGRHQLDDPQLPRLPPRHLRDAAGACGPATRRSASAPRFYTGWEVTAARRLGADGEPHVVRTDGGDVRARSVRGRDRRAPTASSASSRLEELVGHGRLLRRRDDAPPARWRGTTSSWSGGGNSAGQAALHLARFARSVTILVRRPRPRGDDVAATSIDEIEYNPRISVPTCSDGRRRRRRRAGSSWLVPRGHRTPASGSRRGVRRPVPAARRRAAVRLAP